MGIEHLFAALQDIPTIEHVDINDNIVKVSTTELCKFLKANQGLKYLNLSDCLIKRKQQEEVFGALSEHLSQPGSKFEEIVWNQDPKKSLITDFVEKVKGAQSSLKRAEFCGIFLKRDNRSTLREGLKEKDIELVLFKPDFTDDESEEHDDSEEESEVSEGAE